MIDMCRHPIYMTYLPWINDDTGNRAVKVLPLRPFQDTLEYFENFYGKENVFSVPCGKCLDCKLQYSRNWSIRCMLEASQYSFNVFLTLTYDDQHLPSDHKLCKRDLQLFFKRVRKKHPDIRYFACGEYGETSHRPHYHVILFNCGDFDFKYYGRRPREGLVFKCKELEDLWQSGLIDIGEVSFDSCGYVARYVMKKVFNEEKTDEFTISSLRPGIGFNWCLQHLDELFNYNKIIFNFGDRKEAPIPPYFLRIMQRENPVRFESFKRARLKEHNSQSISNLLASGLLYREQLYDLNSYVVDTKLKKLKRGL